MLSSRAARRLVPPVVGLPCVVAVTIYGELSAGALVAVLAAGAVVAGVALAQRAGKAAPPVGRAGRPWLGWLLAALTWELVTLVVDGLPTLSDLADVVLAPPAARAAATAGWLTVGAWLLTRPAAHREGT